MTDPHELENVALDPERRRFVIAAFEKLAHATHYEVLGVPRTVDKKALKAAYYELMASVHPDRYFGKNLGSYKAKMEAIFSRATVAYEILSVPEKRAEYNAVLRAATTAQPAAVQTRSSGTPAPPTLRQQGAMGALKQRFDLNRARELVEAGRRACAANDFVAAEAAYGAAAALVPQDADLRAAHEKVRALAIGAVIDGIVKKAAIEEHLGQWAQAAESWKRVLAARPGDPGVTERLARVLAKANASK